MEPGGPQRGDDAWEESNRMRRSLPIDRVRKVILSRENSLSKAQIPQKAWPFHETAAASSWPEHRGHTGEWGEVTLERSEGAKCERLGLPSKKFALFDEKWSNRVTDGF